MVVNAQVDQDVVGTPVAAAWGDHEYRCALTTAGVTSGEISSEQRINESVVETSRWVRCFPRRDDRLHHLGSGQDVALHCVGRPVHCRASGATGPRDAINPGERARTTSSVDDAKLAVVTSLIVTGQFRDSGRGIEAFALQDQAIWSVRQVCQCLGGDCPSCNLGGGYRSADGKELRGYGHTEVRTIF